MHDERIREELSSYCKTTPVFFRTAEERIQNMNVNLQPDEAPLDWLARIAPEEWDATENGYNLILQSGDRRVVIDPLATRTAWEERIEIDDDAFDERWVQREVIEGRWHVQTTAGLLLWGVSDTSEMETTRATGESERGTDGNTHEREVC